MSHLSFRDRRLYLPALLTLLFHLPALFCDFVWDDVGLIRDHPLLAEPSFVGQAFLRDYGLEMSERTPNSYYRPLLMVVAWTLRRVAGPSPLAYHLFSLIVSAASVTLLTWLVARAPGVKGATLPLVAGSIVAAHPARVELVSLFMSLPDLVIEIAGLLILLAVAARPWRCRPWMAFAICLAASAAAGLSKETSFVVLPAMAAAALVFAARERDGHAAGGAAGIAVGLAAAWVLRARAGVQPPGIGVSLGMLMGEGSGRALRSAGMAVARIAVPGPTIFMNWDDFPASPWALGGVVLLGAGFAALVIRLAWVRRDLWAALIAAWFGGGLANLMLVTARHIPYSDRYLSVVPGVVALCFAVRRLLVWMDGKWPDAALSLRRGHVPLLLLGTSVGLYGAFTFGSSWKCLTPVSFYSAMAEDNPGMAYPRIILANIMLFDLGDFDRMERYANEAIAISPDTQRARELGKLFAKRYIAEARFGEALRHIEWAGQVLTDDAEVHSLKAISLHGLGRTNEALASVREALSRSPTNASYLKQLRIIEGGAAATP